MTRTATHYEGKILGSTTRLFRRYSVAGPPAAMVAVSPLDLPPALLYRSDDDGQVMTDPVEVARYALHHPGAHVTVTALHAGPE